MGENPRPPMNDSNAISVGRLRISPYATGVALASVAFIALSAWWLLYDQRLPGGGDPGRHLSTTLGYADLLSDWDLAGLVTFQGDGQFFYPPLVRWIGAVPAALGLDVQDWGTLAVNLVFVPLLAAGCYLVGRRVYGPLAGLLAALFALGTPMVLSLFHVFVLDAPLAAIVAISLAALLATDRFARRRESVIAGALIGVGLLIKTAAPIFLAAPILVMLVLGGWRHWRNVALAAAAMLVIAVPWHLFHLDELDNLSGQAPSGLAPVGLGGEAGYTPELIDRLAVYGWYAINLQYFVPLLILFAIGFVSAVRELRTRPHVPELLAGVVVGYFAFALGVSLRDPRYTLPLLVFVAVIATGWIATTPRAGLRGAGIGLLVAAIALNVTVATTDSLPTARVSAPGDEPNPGDFSQPGTFTFLDDAGYTVGPPRPESLWTRLFEAAERDGVRTAQIRVREAPRHGTDVIGFYVLAEQHGIREVTFAKRPPKHPDLRVDVWYATADEYWIQEEGLPPPCATIPDGTTAPEGSEAVPLKVAVQRRVDGRYERWCDF
jgi:hypothetical protein